MLPLTQHVLHTVPKHTCTLVAAAGSSCGGSEDDGG